MIFSAFETDSKDFYDIKDTERIADFKALSRSLITIRSSGVFDHEHGIQH